MPNRYLRASYTDSKRINALSAEGERMFCRLLVHVDDFGRCEACADLLRGKLFSRQLDKVSETKVKKWIEELADNKLLFLYIVNDQIYIQMDKWEKGRAKTSKCPNPPTDVSKCLQMYTRANKSPDSDSDSDTDTDTDKKFVSPSVEEVEEYVKSKGYSVDAETFVNFYDSKGWMIGKNKMKQWRSAVGTWQKKEPQNHAQSADEGWELQVAWEDEQIEKKKRAQS